MSYTKTNWQNDTAPAINATNLNKIEDGIFNNDSNISSINGTLGVDSNTWVGTTAYGEGDIVIYNDKIYQNISGTSTTTNPAEDTTNWNEITIFDTDSINDNLIDKTKFIKNTNTNSDVNTYSCNYVNNANTYSTSEVKTNKKWIDGKPIYRKVIDCGAMPNGTTKQVASGLTNVFITQIYGIAYNSASTLTLPDVNPSGVQYSLRLFYTYESNAVGITTSTDRSGYNGYVILEYTKTTD